MASLLTFLTLLRGLDLRLIRGGGVIELNLFFFFIGSLIAVVLISIVFVFFHQLVIAFWVPGMDLPNVER